MAAHFLTDADLRKLRDLARRVGAGGTTQRPVAKRRRNPGGGGGAPAATDTSFLALVVFGTPGNTGSIKAAELITPTNKQKLKMYKGTVVRYTSKDVPDPNSDQEGDLCEPESEDAISITWQQESASQAALYPDTRARIAAGQDINFAVRLTAWNWITAPINVGDRVRIREYQVPKGRKRYLIVGRDCG